MKKMDFIDDNQTDKLSESPLSSFTCDDVPFLRGTDNDLCAVDLFFVKIVISCQFRDCNTICAESL